MSDSSLFHAPDESSDPGEQHIVDRIYAAVMEQRLAPRTKLSEAALCEAFGVGRMRVRRALLLLGSQGIVDLQSNKGAFVACPSPREALEVFEARLMLEPGIVRKLCAEIGAEAIAALRAHLGHEQDARDRGDRKAMIRLSGEFHVKLAEAHDNAVLVRMLRELVTRSSLIVGLFGSTSISACPEDEHDQIVEALGAGDADLAEARLRGHLHHIQQGLELDRPEARATDLAAILGG